MCWLKAIAGAWCTSYRLAEPVKLSCVFGCVGEQDTFRHYLVCPSVWHICAEALGCGVPVGIADRLCFSNTNTNSLKLLALVHGVYHATKNDSFCLSHNACTRYRAEIQLRVCGFAKADLVLVQGGAAADQSGDEVGATESEAIRIESTNTEETFVFRGVQLVQDQLPLTTSVTDTHPCQGVRGTAGLDVSTYQ